MGNLKCDEEENHVDDMDFVNTEDHARHEVIEKSENNSESNVKLSDYNDDDDISDSDIEIDNRKPGDHQAKLSGLSILFRCEAYL